MNTKVIVVALLVLVLLAGSGYYYYQTNAKPDLVGQFNVSSGTIAKDLEGRTAPLPYGQVWPFDPTQGITVNIVSKKQVDDFVLVVVDIKCSAEVTPPKDKDKKEEAKAPPPGVKSFKVSLTGLVRLTYERINGEWYMIGVENISLKAAPLINSDKQDQ